MLRREGRYVNCMVHRLVLEAFVGMCPDRMDAAHGNGNRTDNRLENLRWATRRDNLADRVRHGTDIRGEQQHAHKLTEESASQALLDWANSESQTSIAKRLGVTVGTINQLVLGKTWKHIRRPPRVG